MKLGNDHIKMIGVGVSAVAAIAMIAYYRSQSQAEAEAASQAQSSSPFPFFQSAALPGFGPSAPATSTGSPSNGESAVDLNSLITSALGSQTTQSQIGLVNNEQSDWTSIINALLPSQIASFGQPKGGGVNLVQGSFINTNAGFNFALEATPAGGIPYGGIWNASTFGATPSSTISGAPPVAGSTNSTTSTVNGSLVTNGSGT
jgi:hypothetical protein